MQVDSQPGSGRPASRRERQSHARRQQLIEAALDLFGCNGFGQTTVEAITKQAGLGHGTFYRYFESKDDLLQQLVVLAVSRIHDYVIPPPSERATALAQFRYGMRGLLQWFLDHRLTLLAVRGAMALDSKWEREWGRVRGFFWDHMTLNIEWAKRQGIYRGIDEDVVKVSAYHLMLGTAEELVLRSETTPDLDHLADELALICRHAFLKDSGAPWLD